MPCMGNIFSFSLGRPPTLPRLSHSPATCFVELACSYLRRGGGTAKSHTVSTTCFPTCSVDLACPFGRPCLSTPLPRLSHSPTTCFVELACSYHLPSDGGEALLSHTLSLPLAFQHVRSTLLVHTAATAKSLAYNLLCRTRLFLPLAVRLHRSA